MKDFSEGYCLSVFCWLYFFELFLLPAGIELVSRFSWLLYIFGVILIYTGLTMFFCKKGK